ncbi:YcjX family protein [Vibrio sp. S11_S32]|uniref:YcjX family protein n=1 Tax=Vibrio sp. S11_S32 TaxID=2720225 RepID=UPI0016810548|nr:YcjX family protein [Vibrio sp. S11_S32]MBD1577000.1 YcjX family protein [Vibrio sp. S11_S32]
MKLQQEVNDLVKRSLDRHLRLAVTGLSRAGKTAFITSLVNQLLHSSTQDNLPLFEASRNKQLLGAKRIPQTNLMVPRFDYDLAIEQLNETPPQWPEPTRDVSEIRLAIRFKPNKGARRLLKSTSTLYLDIVDYPGEWLLDLPLLDMSFEQWSKQQLKNLQGDNATSIRARLAKEWLVKLNHFDLYQQANENRVAELSRAYTAYLHECKKAGLHWVQPGRFVLPGELEGAPVLQFFPAILELDSDGKPVQDISKNCAYAMLRSRFNEYKKKIVKAFYQQHFASFDRQIVLVDCLQPLNAGHDSFNDMSGAITQLLQSFKYGRNSILKRLFSAKIDKVLFAATKADHVTPDQHGNMVSLLQQLVNEAWQHVSYEGIDMECMSLSSIQATMPGYASRGDTTLQAIKGTTLEQETLTLYPGEVPSTLPNQAYWQQHGFDFHQFRPLKIPQGQSLPHIRMDKAMQFLLGDKLR